MPSPNDILNAKLSSYLVLIPVVIPISFSWLSPMIARFYSIDLLNINKLLVDLQKQVLQEEEIEIV